MTNVRRWIAAIGTTLAVAVGGAGVVPPPAAAAPAAGAAERPATLRSGTVRIETPVAVRIVEGCHERWLARLVFDMPAGGNYDCRPRRVGRRRLLLQRQRVGARCGRRTDHGDAHQPDLRLPPHARAGDPAHLRHDRHRERAGHDDGRLHGVHAPEEPDLGAAPRGVQGAAARRAGGADGGAGAAWPLPGLEVPRPAPLRPRARLLPAGRWELALRRGGCARTAPESGASGSRSGAPASGRCGTPARRR